MSHYDEVLQEARKRASGSAKEFIPKLYHILVDEENKTPEDARGIIEHDLLEYWAKETVRKYLPQETKDQEKVKAGKQGAKATNLILAGGQTVTKPADVTDSGKSGDDEEPTELDLLKIENAQLKDAMHKVQHFQSATQLEEPILLDPLETTLRNKADGVNSFYYDTYGIDLFKNRELAQLKNSGVKTFKRLYFEV
jgi:hypothetical protein